MRQEVTPAAVEAAVRRSLKQLQVRQQDAGALRPRAQKACMLWLPSQLDWTYTLQAGCLRVPARVHRPCMASLV